LLSLYLISPSGLHIITRSVYQKSFRNDDMQGLRLDDIQLLTKLMICNSYGIDDMQRQAVDFFALL